MRIVLLVAALALAPALASAAEPLRMGISAPHGFREGAVQAALIEQALSEALARPVKVKTFGSPDATADALAKGDVDVAWVAPAAFLRAAASASVVPLARLVRRGSGSYRAVFVVKSEAPFHELSDLEGRRVAWLGDDSTSGGLVARAMVASSGRDPSKFFAQQALVKSHGEACRAVIDGRADAAATFSYEGTTQADGCRSEPGWEKLRVVASSRAIPNDLVAVRSAIAPAEREAIRSALARLSTLPSGKRALAEAFSAEGFAPTTDADLALARELLGTKH